MQVMTVNIDKGYIKKLTSERSEKGPCWYLPHFPVIREEKATTKIRIIFDSAAKYRGRSLNDTMLPCPKVQ